MPNPKALKHFYIPEEQSIYLLSHQDAKKLKDWVALCMEQLTHLGYRKIHYIGKGAFGFVFGGETPNGQHRVFKFSRINLPQHVQDRLEEEAFMLSHVNHEQVPGLVEFQHVGKQSILVMQRALGKDLEQVSLEQGPLSPRIIVKIAVQLGEILLTLKKHEEKGAFKPLVHGDIKPSNLVWNEVLEKVELIDWGSSVFAQMDETGQFIGNNVMDLMSGDMQQTNARLGDIYFIGDEQLNGALSSPRFDEQGLASTLYALASGQSCRFGKNVITPESLGLPKLFANILANMLSDDVRKQRQGGDYFFNNLHVLKHLVFSENDSQKSASLIPTWLGHSDKSIETVVYSSRKSFLRLRNDEHEKELNYINDAQFDRYYKNYMQGMGATEKAFIAAVSRLGRYPVVGGVVIRWEADGIYVDSSLNLYNESVKTAFELAVNNVIYLARAIHRQGVFKCCMFNAKDTLHIERMMPSEPFVPSDACHIPFELSALSVTHDQSRTHSYFEDGQDPDELLQLPEVMITLLKELNRIHHTGCIIFEALPTHLKIHSYFMLLDHESEGRFKQLLEQIVKAVPRIEGLGISGFMKLPYKDTRHFDHKAQLPEKYYPRNPRAC
ncbi:protein kinase domain-containing protein [Alteromonas sp. ASW11-130]|uniref:protein kinase domain-containing protein n=1 Tax=Alteromonas sp. ASW11-130 TaxID=3015775 RepID=UPI0022418D01|nr:serine/threonine protein kinase [Alteromonas sp. ASW11-130]MCW8092283.1 serine/threonine protein kinase [Alteromonas sp. ASW11-130]